MEGLPAVRNAATFARNNTEMETDYYRTRKEEKSLPEYELFLPVNWLSGEYEVLQLLLTNKDITRET